MNLVYGEVVSLFAEEGMLMGKVRVRGVVIPVPLSLVEDVRAGDTVLICDGVALSRVEDEKGDIYVSGNTR